MPNAQEPSTDALQFEIDRLTRNDKPERAKQFAALVRANVRSWQARHPQALIATKWELAEARLARFDAEYADDLGSLFYAEGKAWITQLVKSLISQSDPAWLIQCPRRFTLVRRLLPHDAMRLWDARP